MKPSLCLNMIVRNESARMERCLRSVLPFVKAAVICDTGSTDGTPDIVWAVCKEFGVPVTVSTAEFHNFGQARNAAFLSAQLANDTIIPFCQHALLVDADMELVVDEGYNFEDLDARALNYGMMQKGGAVSYFNSRIINLDWGQPPYVGVTHEYVDVPSAGMITGARFIDHADGSNRANKFVRDAQLLEADLKTDPNNGRSLYYLGNSYKDWGDTDKTVLPWAADAYNKRIKMGGWDEETHSAMTQMAFVQKSRDRPEEFVSRMIDAYNFRPQRAEPLYELAKYYREKGDNAASLLFSKAGLDKKRPDDLLFVNDFIYEHGLRYEYSIAGFYDEAERPRAYSVTNALALDPSCPSDFRWSCRNNLQHFVQPLSLYCSSFQPYLLHFIPPDGYTAMNPSVEECNGVLRVNIRTVNYRMDEHGRYMIGEKNCNDAPIDTRNFACRLTDDMRVFDAKEVLWHRQKPAWDMVTGLEDIRLYRHAGNLWFSACVRELSAGGVCQQVRGQLIEDHDPKYMLTTTVEVMSDETTYEKNWMPWPHAGAHDFIYRLDKVQRQDGTQEKFPTSLHVGDISGSSQLIPFRGGYLAVAHEAIGLANGLRNYWHRFAYFDKSGQIQRVSKPFNFFTKQIEFCAGLCQHPSDPKLLVLSYGVKDAQPFVATVASEEVAMFLWSQL